MARVVIPGIAHHVTQRGNRGEDIFFGDADHRRFIELLREYAVKHGLAVRAWCLMTNHFHLVAIPARAGSLAETLKPVNLRYAQHVNWTRNLTGRLWQGRFYSCPLDERHFWAAVRYVERNPVRAKLVRRAWDWPWSSAAGHCGLRTDPLTTGPLELPQGVSDWRELLREPEDATMLKTLQTHTLTGRPAGDKSFVAKLERLLGRRLHALPVGRPRKKNEK